MSEILPEWKSIFGAKVESPKDMPYDIFKARLLRCVLHHAFGIPVRCTLLFYRTHHPYHLRSVGMPISRRWSDQSCHLSEKRAHSENMEPYWHSMCGRNFGSLATHQARRFVYSSVSRIPMKPSWSARSALNSQHWFGSIELDWVLHVMLRVHYT